LLRATRTTDAAEEEFERESRELLQEVAKTGFALLGGGHFDFAKMFAERYLRVVRRRGFVSVVMPQSMLLIGGWSKLRTALLRRGDSIAVEARNSNGWMFEKVHKSYAIVFLTLAPADDQDVPTISVYPGVNSLDQFRKVREQGPMCLPLSEIEALSEDSVVPWFNSANDGLVFAKMRNRPKLSIGDGWIQGKSDSSRWDFSGSGKHKAYAEAKKTSSDAWGVMMTRHVDQYVIANDPIRKWVNSPSTLASEHPRRGLVVKISQALFNEEHPLITYRFPSRNDDSRTLIATALPARGYFFSTGYAHGIVHPEGTDVVRKMALLGYLNSVVADWWSRRFVDRHVGSRIINGLPLPNWSDSQFSEVSTCVQELLVRGGLHDLPGGLPIEVQDHLRDSSDRDLRLRLDLLAAEGFGLNRDDLEVLLADFKDTKDSVPVVYRMDLLAMVGEANAYSNVNPKPGVPA